MRQAQAEDIILLVSERDRKRFIRTIKPGGKLHTHRGTIAYDDIIGKPYGTTIKTHMGFSYYLFLPTTEELIVNMKRRSQIIFPKDSGYIIMKMGVRPGTHVIEAGTGSGGLTLALATMVGDEGHVYSYDVRSDMQDIAQENLRNIGLESRVTFYNRDAQEGFDQTDVDAVFLDMLHPTHSLDQAHAALRGSGSLGCIVPTVNQLSDLIRALDIHRGYGFIETEELLLRTYKTLPARIRPEDRIVGHTGYLVFARSLVPPQSDTEQEPAE